MQNANDQNETTTQRVHTLRLDSTPAKHRNQTHTATESGHTNARGNKRIDMGHQRRNRTPRATHESDIDSFAGGGGTSIGIETATGRPVSAAINHDEAALAMHAANHPRTRHYPSDIWHIDPATVVAAHGPVRIAWFSPDCTHHSKARGDTPIRTPGEHRSRDLAWSAVLWAQRAKPRIIIVENVEEFVSWGPLGADGRACPHRRGETFTQWVEAIRGCGYHTIQWRELRACDFGTPTIRKRLLVVARRDGHRIGWPKATHGEAGIPYVGAAQCIDWDTPMHSIFLNRAEARAAGCKRPLAEATMRRIGRGVERYVIKAKCPFIIPYRGTKVGGKPRIRGIDAPLHTLTTQPSAALVIPYFVARYGERAGQAPQVRDIGAPMPTIVPTGNGTMLVAVFMAQHNTGLVGHDVRRPLSTIVARGSTQQLVTVTMTGGAGAPAHAGVTADLSNGGDAGQAELFAGGAESRARAHREQLSAFLARYTGTCDPTIRIDGVACRIADIAMRMLTPRELFTAQGFPRDYRIEVEHRGKRLTKEAQTRMAGNAVCPQIAEAVVRANLEQEAA